MRSRGAFTLIEPFDRLRTHQGERAAFTLIELLIVIAIIALLLTILAPSVENARRLAERAVCGSNLHELGSTAMAYANTYDHFVPRDYNEPREVSDGRVLFAAKFLPYVDGRTIPPEIECDGTFYSDDWQNRITPADEYMYPIFEEVGVYQCPSWDEDEYVLDYIVNAANFENYRRTGGYGREQPATSIFTIPDAGETLYLGEVNDVPRRGPHGFSANDAGKLKFMPYGRSGEPNSSPRYIGDGDERHFGGSTVVFFDGHAEARPLTPEGFPVELFNPLEKD
jgi:prepilin-type N-terminal cleavage/methylation domain-containing protein/prepilin-type processing-associated H-X9-DG protein